MENISPEFIERYQLILEREPKSKVFAPLAEAYRKIGLAHKAYAICKTGLNYHPHFAGGHIAMARSLMVLEEPKRAIEHLEKATELAPENILAYQILAETQLSLRNTKEALMAFKMVLFLSPDNAKAQKAVKKLESLTADEFPESLFEELHIQAFKEKEDDPTEPKKAKIDPPPAFVVPKSNSNDAKQNRLERYLSLIDAYIVRNDNEKAFSIYNEARVEFAREPELEKRLRIINPNTISEEPTAPTKPPIRPARGDEVAGDKIQTLRNMLFKINKKSKS